MYVTEKISSLQHEIHNGRDPGREVVALGTVVKRRT